MRVLIVIAHGSRSQRANKEFRTYVKELRVFLSGMYGKIGYAFLDEVATPSLAVTAEKMIAAGATGIDVYPYFLIKGKHARRDIPALVSMLKAKHPSCKIKVMDYLGRSDELVSLSMRHIISQRQEQ